MSPACSNQRRIKRLRLGLSPIAPMQCQNHCACRKGLCWTPSTALRHPPLRRRGCQEFKTGWSGKQLSFFVSSVNTIWNVQCLFKSYFFGTDSYRLKGFRDSYKRERNCSWRGEYVVLKQDLVKAFVHYRARDSFITTEIMTDKHGWIVPWRVGTLLSKELVLNAILYVGVLHALPRGPR